uniref:C2H2-type domain-containing protein n=1 Tax=Salvator merianae TaxID=96440 RepID=A0A8D0BF54_SALMN
MEIQWVTVKEETGPEAPPICSVCQEELPNLAGSQGQVPQCQGCKRLFLKQANWLPGNQEGLALPTERPYSCSFCPKRFKRASDRRDHERVHTGERPYGCAICGKRFTQSSVLSGHMRIHTGERPFRCDVCFKSFNNGSNFRKHQRIHGHPSGYGDKGIDGKDCVILSEKKHSRLFEGQGDCSIKDGLPSRQNGCQIIREMRGNENKKGHDPRGTQPGPVMEFECRNSLRQPVGNHFQTMGLNQDDHCGDNIEGSNAKILRQADDRNRHVVGHGKNDYSDGHAVTQNSHNLRQPKHGNDDRYIKDLRQNRAGGSYAQGEGTQIVDSHSGRLQRDSSGCGKGLLQAGGNRTYAHKLSQDSAFRGFLARKPNGSYLKGLKHSSVESTGVYEKQPVREAGDINRPNPSRGMNCLELRQNGSHGHTANGLRINGASHVRGPSQGDSTKKEKQGDFQTCTPEKTSALSAKASSWTFPDKVGLLAWEEKGTGTMRERGEFEGCSSSNLPASTPLWELERSKPHSLPCRAPAPPRDHSFQTHFRISPQSWEKEEAVSSFPVAELEPNEQHPQSAFDTKPFLCFACPKQFRRATDLKEHLRVHTGERPFGCGVCGKRFTQSSALATHRRLHTGEKPFECAVCYRRFNNSSNFAKHRRLHGQVGAGRGKGVEKEVWHTKAQ